MIIRGTEPDFFELIDKKYGGKISFPRKSREEMFEFCKEIFQMKKVPEDILDANARILLQEFRENICTEEKINVYLVPLKKNTKIFYQDYHGCFQGNAPLYIFEEEENNLWRSNSDLLSLCLEIYLGIESTDRIEKTRKYFDYLNCIYEVDFLLENTKISQLNAVELLQQTLNN